jgi:hypothetical protein
MEQRAEYIDAFHRSNGNITAFSPGHPFDPRAGGVESDDEGMDRSAPRTVRIATPIDGLLIAMTADLHSNELRNYIDLPNYEKGDMPKRRISLAEQGSLPLDTDLFIFAGDLGCR